MTGAESAVASDDDWRADKDARLIPYGETNLGTPLSLADGPIVPTELFFVRSNYTVPTVDPGSWRLGIGGLVNRPLELSLDDIVTMPQRTVTAFLECAGNGRTHLDPPVEGTPWRDDAVGCATWTGVPLPHVLELAGVRPESVDVVSQGADDPQMRRGLPLDVALDPDTLLAWKMNEQPLLTAHGAPLRLLVPGWAGIASTKWLVGLELVAERFDGYWNAEKYVLIGRDGESLGRVQRMPVKSSIARPAAGARIKPGAVTISGYAWSGCGRVTSVEVSIDGGETYGPAAFTQPADPRAWACWTYEAVATPGPMRLRCRATDATGRTQPDEPVWNAQGYQINTVTEVAVEVQAVSG